MSPKAKIVCDCLKVTEAQLLKAIKAWALRTIKDVIRHTSAGEGCTACHPLLRDYLERQRGGRPCGAMPSLPSPAGRSESSPSLPA